MSAGGSLDFFNELASKIEEQQISYLAIASPIDGQHFSNVVRFFVDTPESIINMQIVLRKLDQEFDEYLKKIEEELNTKPKRKRRKRKPKGGKDGESQ